MLRKEAGGRLDQWAASPSGKLFLDYERKQVETLISPSVHGEAPLWLSAFQCKPPVEAVSICSRDDDASGLGGTTVIAREFELPFSNQQFSTVISSHVHEYTDDPHEYLRELARIIEPEGQLIISGYNPFNLFGIGLRHKLYKREGAPVYPSHYLSIYRLKDWLRLLVSNWKAAVIFIIFRCLARHLFCKSLNGWNARGTAGGLAPAAALYSLRESACPA